MMLPGPDVPFMIAPNERVTSPPSPNPTMAHSLNEKCTPLKKEYDNCFNAWFEGYLEPAVATTDQARSEFSKRKAQEFQDKCGPVWNSYRECVQVR